MALCWSGCVSRPPPPSAPAPESQTTEKQNARRIRSHWPRRITAFGHSFHLVVEPAQPRQRRKRGIADRLPEHSGVGPGCGRGQTWSTNTCGMLPPHGSPCRHRPTHRSNALSRWSAVVDPGALCLIFSFGPCSTVWPTLERSQCAGEGQCRRGGAVRVVRERVLVCGCDAAKAGPPNLRRVKSPWEHLGGSERLCWSSRVTRKIWSEVRSEISAPESALKLRIKHPQHRRPHDVARFRHRISSTSEP